MGTKLSPGKFDCYAAARDDEPMFVLLGRDRHFWVLVKLWIRLRRQEGENDDKVKEASTVATAGLRYYMSSHNGRTPLLTLPEELLNREGKRWMVALSAALVLAILTIAVMTFRMSTMQKANQELAAAVLSTCQAARLGQMAWWTFGPNDEPVCLKTETPPTREQWQRFQNRPNAGLRQPPRPSHVREPTGLQPPLYSPSGPRLAPKLLKSAPSRRQTTQVRPENAPRPG